ncbi:MAG: ribosome maturation factor RimP [Myxococcales bacterium]|nr:ribosome maturation factor RimP [Myxococcales bacterium]
MTATDGKTRSEIDLAALFALCEPVVHAHGLELVDVEWTTAPTGRVLRVTIERPEASAPTVTGSSRPPVPVASGVTLEDCVSVSRDLSVALDVEDLVASSYSLEVTSPGVDRPLRSRRDYRRAVGHLVKLKLAQPAVDGQRVLRGPLLAAEDDELLIEVDGKTHVVAPGDVAEARYVIEFGGAGKPKPRAPRGGKIERNRGTAARSGRRADRDEHAGAAPGRVTAKVRD